MRLLDLYCGAGGAAVGYHRAGFDDITGVDNRPQPHYPYSFVFADALEYLTEHGKEFDAIHASPPCQAYSIMNNLPWLKHKNYPLLILPTLELLEALGKPYVIENVMGARHGAIGLRKRGLEAHSLKAGWLCGTAFGLPFYRHRLFATNWLWLAPEHPKHTLNLHPRAERWIYGGTVKGLPGGTAGLDTKPNDDLFHKNGKSILGAGDLGKGSGLSIRQYIRQSGQYAGKVETTLAQETSLPNLANWQNNPLAGGIGIGSAKGWRLAAEGMGIDWMNRQELTQAVPPVYTEFIGKQLLSYLVQERLE